MNDDIVAKLNDIAAQLRQATQSLGIDYLSRQSVPGAGHLPVGIGAQALGLLPPDQPNGSVLTLDSTRPERVRWASGFPGPDTGNGITFAQIFAPSGRWQVQVWGTLRGHFQEPTINSFGVFGVPNTGLTGSFDRVSWDFTADPSVSGFSTFTMLEPGIWSLFVRLIGLDNAGNPTDVTQPWSFGLVALPFYPGAVRLKVPPIAPIPRIGYSEDSFDWTRPVDLANFGTEILISLSLNGSFFSQHQLLGELLWLGPI